MSEKELLKHCKRKNALSYNELKLMSNEELEQVFSLCWKDAESDGYSEETLRCSTTGINSLVYHEKYSVLDWSDDDGDPNIRYGNPDDKIHHLSNGRWSYGIYKSVQQVKQDSRDKKINKIIN
jgi:hypothetical protein